MTKVVFSVGETGNGGVVMPGGSASFIPATLTKAGVVTIIPKMFHRKYSRETFTVELSPTDVGEAWFISIKNNTNPTKISGYYKIPNVATINYNDLESLDPETLGSHLEPEPEWWAIARSITNGVKGDKGDKGEPGKEGSVWYQGSGYPTIEGKVNDKYLDVDSGTVYTFK